MATTYLNLVNRILRRLRETEVVNVSDTAYSSLIGDFVNEAKIWVEDSHGWIVGRSQLILNTISGVNSYTVTGIGQRYKLLDDPNNGRPAVYNLTSKYQLLMTISQRIRKDIALAVVQQQTPYYFAFEGADSTTGDPKILLYFTPDQVYSIEFNFYIPQDNLKSNIEVLLVPEEPVFYKAYSLAVSERGEDGGTSFDEIDAFAKTALADAIRLDALKDDSEFEAYVN